MSTLFFFCSELKTSSCETAAFVLQLMPSDIYEAVCARGLDVIWH